MRLYATFANAVQNYSDVLNAHGFHYEHGNWLAIHDKTGTTEPVAPPVSGSPMFDSSMDLPLSALAAHADPGIDDSKLPGLLSHITQPVPNGDTGKLDSVHSAWDAFAKHDGITKVGVGH